MASRRTRSASAGAQLPPPLRARLRSAADRHQAGDLAQAEAMYRQVEREVPGHPEVLHLLGVALHQQGCLVEARRCLQRAARASPRVAQLQASLGELLRDCGDHDGALECFREALRLEPGHAQAGTALALQLHAAGRLEEARDAFARVADTSPRSAEAYGNLGIAEQSLGRVEQAIGCFRRATGLAPDNAQAWNNLGAALHEAGDLDAAAAALERALALAPDLARVHYNLSRLSAARGDATAAERQIRRALEIEPEVADYHLHLGYVLRAVDRFDEAVGSVEQALRIAPGNALAHNDLGVSLLVGGRFDAAERHLLRAIELDPELAIAWENLARTRRFGPRDDALMQRIAARLAASPSPSLALHLHFALGKMWDDRGEPEHAFRHFEQANRLKRASVAYAPDAHARFASRVIQTFDRAFLDRHAGAGHGHASQAPIFVLGMPRSGTTLVEQVLASHPRVRAGGELEFFVRLARQMQHLMHSDRAYPECALALGGDDLHALGVRYLEQAPRLGAGVDRFTDKMPLNFEHLGLAATIFPHAKFVHCRRDAMDTCLSVYFTHFSRDNAFAYDLADIGAYYDDYRRLMAHWHALLGARLYALDYEALVADQEQSTRALLEHCGLAWDPACLEFHRTERQVGTASHWQVRQPLYADAVSRWRRYARWLQPLERALGR